MAQKLNLDFSIGESIVKGCNSTPELKTDSIDINTTNISIVSVAKDLVNTSNDTIDSGNKNYDSVKQNYAKTVGAFKAIQTEWSQWSPNLGLRGNKK